MDLAGELIDIANRYRDENSSRIFHVDSHMGASRYVADARRIKGSVASKGTILDLGCGWGQMAYLLARLGLKVIASDIHKETPFFVRYFNETLSGRIDYHWGNILDDGVLEVLDGKKFDAICLSGVLEHVADFGAFLKRLRPRLTRNGKLFIFRFPNRHSWIERINEFRFGDAIDHPLRFTRKELAFMLRWHGYRVEEAAYEEIFPVNLKGFPDPVLNLYRKLDWAVMPTSRVLCRIPLLSNLSTSFRVVCTKAYDY